MYMIFFALAATRRRGGMRNLQHESNTHEKNAELKLSGVAMTDSKCSSGEPVFLP
jgi:hypothetical protein